MSFTTLELLCMLEDFLGSVFEALVFEFDFKASLIFATLS